jgi:hypothetical protein
MKRKLWVGLASAAVAAFVGAYALSPVFAAHALIQAGKRGDAETLRRLVDFPALRASLKDELNQAVVDEMRDRGGDTGEVLAGLGMLLAPALVSGAVDTLITPEAVGQMVRSGQAPDPTDRPAPAKAQPKADGDDIHQAWGYRTLDTFAVTLTRKDRPDRRLALVMTRRGLFDWKLTGVDFQRDR